MTVSNAKIFHAVQTQSMTLYCITTLTQFTDSEAELHFQWKLHIVLYLSIIDQFEIKIAMIREGNVLLYH